MGELILPTISCFLGDLLNMKNNQKTTDIEDDLLKSISIHQKKIQNIDRLLKIAFYKNKSEIITKIETITGEKFQIFFKNIHIQCHNISNALSINPGDIVTMLIKLPESHYKDLSSIVYFPEFYELIPYCRTKKIARGYYSRSLRQIVIGKCETKKRFNKIFYHELGHHLFYTKLLEKKKFKEWKSLYVKEQNIVFKYAEIHYMEDFAECYSLFILNPQKLLAESKNKYQYVKSLFKFE